MGDLKYKIGDKVRIKSLNWYNENKNEFGDVKCSLNCSLTKSMSIHCGSIQTIECVVDGGMYWMKENPFNWADEMIESLVERNGKTYPYKIGDRVVLKGSNRCATITDLKYNSWGNLSYYIKIDNDKDISIDYPTDLLLPYDNMAERQGLMEENSQPKFNIGDVVYSRTFQRNVVIMEILPGGFYAVGELYGTGCTGCFKTHEDNLCKDIVNPTLLDNPTDDNMIEGIVEKNVNIDVAVEETTKDISDKAVDTIMGGLIVGKSFNLPQGYIFKDQAGNEIHALKIVLEKANTLKTQSDNMETETHKGYCTTEEETTNKSKKVAWFTFGDNDFADKVELDLSNRELIQESGKWFVVKKKNEYPKTFLGCCDVLGIEDTISRGVKGYKSNLLDTFQKLLICRDAYWKLYGEEIGKPWEPDLTDNVIKHCIEFRDCGVCKVTYSYTSRIFTFPTAEMRDDFFNAFKDDIEKCKELL